MWVPDVLNRVLTGGGGGKTACEVIFDKLNQVTLEIIPITLQISIPLQSTGLI